MITSAVHESLRQRPRSNPAQLTKGDDVYKQFNDMAKAGINASSVRLSFA